MNNKIVKSKGGAWAAFIVLLALLVFAFPLLTAWWMFIPFFFGFMAVFCHLIAVNIFRFNAPASSKLDVAAMVSGVLTVLGIIAVWIMTL